MTELPVRGNKHICAGCATRFYDLNASPAICPQCKKKVVVLVRAPRRRRRSADDNVAEKSSSATAHKVIVTEPVGKSKHVRWK